nr:hypothetical protein [Pirellulales bacterium]
MNRASSYAMPLNLSILSPHAAWFGILGALLSGAAPQRPAHAITIDMEYTDEGDTEPHPENPTWDPAGVILKAHFQAAKTIWESLLPGGGTYSFDYHWDDDIGENTLGLATDTPLDTYIEINPNFNWFADPTPGDDKEFSTMNNQKLFGGLSGSEKSTYFPGTAPPDALEVSFSRSGIPSSSALITLSASGQTIPSPSGPVPVAASNGYDLLSVILHEMGHILGINGVEPGEYNIYPHHVGGLVDVLVLEDSDSGHLAGDATTPGFLMNPGTPPGRRYYPSATDVLVIAEDQGITDVHLQRVGSISGGAWGDQSKWIGADVPDRTQDVYIRHGGVSTLNADAEAKSLIIGSGSSVAVQDRQLSVDGTLTFNGAAVSMAPGGTIEANTINGTNGTLTTTAGSMVRFNGFTAGTSTSASFNGSVAIGYNTAQAGSGTFFSSFDPSTISNWNVAEQLAVGDKNTSSTLIIDNGATFVSASGRVGAGTIGSGQGTVNIDGLGSSWTTSGALAVRSGLLSIANQGRLTVGGALDVRGASGVASQVNIASSGTLFVTGGVTVGPF